MMSAKRPFHGLQRAQHQHPHPHQQGGDAGVSKQQQPPHHQHWQQQQYSHPTQEQQQQQHQPYFDHNNDGSNNPQQPGRYAQGGTPQPASAMIGMQQQQQQQGQAASSSPPQVQIQGKLRTTCTFCMSRKKRCDYVEINGVKQPCSLCKSKGKKCVFDMKPQRGGKSKGTSSSSPVATVATASVGSSGASTALAVLKRTRMAPSPATGLVGLEENIFVADFFDRLGFFPMASHGNIQRAIIEVLFKPAEKRLTAMLGRDAAGAAGGVDGSMEGVFGGTLAIRRRWEDRKEESGESKAFSCMLWCTIALGAMTSNLSTKMVTLYVRLAEEAIDGLWSVDVPTAKAHAIMSMLYGWMDKEHKFAKHLKVAQDLVHIMDDDPERTEEVPMELRDMIKEMERVLALHYMQDEEAIRKCAYSADGDAPAMSLALMSDGGLFHLVRFYTDGVFKAFWRDLDNQDSKLTETTAFAQKNLKDFLEIEKVASSRTGFKNTGGAVYIRAAMQFIRLPLKTNPMDRLRSSIELTEIMCKVPGMIRYGPVKHFVHCLVMGLAKPAMVGIDDGAYEKLRRMYNSLDIRGASIMAAEDMNIDRLCDHRFCRGMAWIHHTKTLEMEKAAAAGAAAAAGTNNAGGGPCGGALDPPIGISGKAAEAGPSSGSGGGGDAAFASGVAAPASSPHLTGVGDRCNRVDRFPAAADTGAARGNCGANDLYWPLPYSPKQSPSSQHPSLDQQPQNSLRLNETDAAPFDGIDALAGAAFAMKQEGMELYFESRGDNTRTGPGPSSMYPTTGSWDDQLRQQQRSQERKTFATRYPAGSPSLSAFQVQPQQQQQQRQQQQQQPQRQQQRQCGEGASSLSPAAAGARGESATAEADPTGLYAFSRAQMRHHELLEQSDNVNGLGELLLNCVNDDAVPEVYQGESDADEFASFFAGSSGDDGKEDDESIRTLATALGVSPDSPCI